MKRSLGLLAVAVTVLAGCGRSGNIYEVPVEAVTEVAPLIEPLPATVGVYYSPAFRQFGGTITDYVADRRDYYHFALGEPSTALFDWVFPAAFETTLVVRSKPPLSGGDGDLDGVIEPRIKGFTLNSISYEITLYAPSGEVIAAVPAKGTHVGRVFGARRANRAMRSAMRNASAAFLSKLPEHPEIKEWIAKLDADRRVERPKPDPRQKTEGVLP